MKKVFSLPIHCIQLSLVVLLTALLPFVSTSAGVVTAEVIFGLIFLFLLYNSILTSLLRESLFFNSLIFVSSLFFISTIIISLIPAVNNGVVISFYFRRAFPFFLLLAFIPVFNVLEIKKESLIILLSAIILVCAYDSFKILFSIYRNFNQIYLIVNLEEIRTPGNGILQVSLPIVLISLLLTLKSKTARIVLKIALFLSLLSLIFSFTRSYWFGFFVALFFLMVALRKEDKVSLIKVLSFQAILFASAFLLLLIFKSDSAIKILIWIKERLYSTTQLSFLPTFIGRLDEISTLLKYIPKSPIYGFGLGATYNFYNISPFAWEGVGYKDLFYSHNFYAYHLFATGILGLFAFFFFIVSVIKTGVSTYIKNQSNKLNLISIFLSSIIFGTLFTSLTSPQFVDITSDFVIGLYIGIIAFTSKYMTTNNL
jgi:O-antigen ligase